MKQLVVALFCIFSVMSVAWAAKPIVKTGENVQIVDVQVETHKRYRGTANFLEAVRYRTQNAAYKASEEGTKEKLWIKLRILNIPNPGDKTTKLSDSTIQITAKLFDIKTGKPSKRFKVKARIYRDGKLVGPAALGATPNDHVKDEKHLARILAPRIMKAIYGDEHWDSIANRQPARAIKPNYPMSWEEAVSRYQCTLPQADNTASTHPAQCSKYLDNNLGFQIVNVQMESHTRFKATANLPEEIRYLMQNAAYKFSEKGARKTLKILLKTLSIPKFNSGRNTRGDSNIRVTATLIDNYSRMSEKKIKFKSRLYRKTGSAAATTPEEAVKYRIEDEKILARLLADQLMTKIYGKDHAASVKTRQPGQKIQPSYPMSWEDAGQQFQPEE